MPLISVITPVYNNKKYLINCVTSILNQNFCDYEHIIVDDGSTDGTSEICDKIARENERIKVIHQENQWIYASFNNGVKEASGEYIYILNSDDTLESETFTTFSKIIEKYQPDVIWTQVRECEYDENIGTITKYSNTGLAGQPYDKDIFLENKDMLHSYWRDLYYYGYTMNQANLYKKELIKEHPFRNDYYGADSLFNISIADDIQKSFILAKPIYNFYKYSNGDMNASVGKVYGYEFEMFREILSGHSELISKWNGAYDDLVFFKNIELNTCLNCIKLLHHPGMSYSSEEIIEIILTKFFTEDFIKETELVDSFAIVDPIVTKELLLESFSADIDQYSKYYFIKLFFDEIRKGDKDSIDKNVIENMLNNKNNPCHYGLSICLKLGLV